MLFATRGWTRAKFNPESATCPFHDKDGLCLIQKEKGHEAIPWTCQSYPRFYRNYGEFEECSLDLSCIAVARMMMGHLGDIQTVEVDHEPYTQPCTTNEDTEFLHYLLKIRQEMTEAVFSGNLEQVMTNMYSFAAKLQDTLGSTGNDRGCDLSFKEYINNEALNEEMSMFPLSAVMLRKFLGSSLCHPRLRIKGPLIYSMFTSAKRYLKNYDERSWTRAVEAFLKENPGLYPVLSSYLSYNLHQYFLRSYETYSFRKQMALAIIHTNMILLLFITLAYESDSRKPDHAAIIAAYNRRAYFNDSIQDEMYRIFENLKNDT